MIGVVAKADQQRIALPQGRGAQVPGRAQYLSQQDIIFGRVFLHVKFDDLLTPGDDDLVCRSCQSQGFPSSAAFLARITLFLDLQSVGLKEPLSSLAAGSALAMIIPIDFSRHRVASWGRLLACPDSAAG